MGLMDSSSIMGRGRRAALKDNINTILTNRQRQRAEAAQAVLEQMRQGPVQPENVARGVSIMQQTGISQVMTEPSILDQLEEKLRRKTELNLLAENPKTAGFFQVPENAAGAFDAVEDLTFFESLGNAVARRADAIADNTLSGFNIRDAKMRDRLYKNAQLSLSELVELQREMALEKQIESDQATIDAGPKKGGRGPRRPVDVAKDKEKSKPREELSMINAWGADGAAFWKYLESRVMVGRSNEELQTMRGEIVQELDDLLADRSLEARERALIWQIAPWRAEIEQDIANMDAKDGYGSLVAMLQLAKNKPGKFANYMVEVAAESGVTLGASLTVGALTKNPWAVAATTTAVSGFTSGGLFFDELVAEYGYDIATPEGRAEFLKDPRVLTDLQDKATAYGIVVGLMDGASAGAASKVLIDNPVGDMVLQTIVQGALGGGGELLGRLAAGEEINWPEVIMEALAEVTTAPLEVGGLALGGVRQKIGEVQVQKQRRKLFEILAGRVQGSELKKRDAATFQNAVKEVTKNGPAENVYIDPDGVEEMFQASDTDIKEVFDAVPDLDWNEFVEARDNGSLFAIPTSVYAAHIAGTEVDTLIADHIKINPDDMTAAEVKTFTADLAETQADLAQNVDKLETVIGELEGPLAEEFDRLTTEIVAAQGVTRQAANRMAGILVASARTGAQRANMSVGDYLRRYSLPAIRSSDADMVPTVYINPAEMLDAINENPTAARSQPYVAEVMERLDNNGAIEGQVSGEELIQALREIRDEGVLSIRLPEEIEGLPASLDVPDGEEMQQTATLRGGEEDASEWGIDTSKLNKTRDIALKLQERQRKKYGKTPRDRRGPKTLQKLAEWMADELEFELQSPARSALGWYGPKFQAALDNMGKLWPALTDEKAARRSKVPGVRTVADARALATALFAVSSNGTKVVKNVDNAMQILLDLEADGRVGTVGTQRAVMNANIETMLRLAEEMGGANMQAHLTQEMTMSQVNQDIKRAGGKPKTGYPAAMRVPYAARYLGPKLAAFYANLTGAEGYLTMDLWFTRSIRRYQGDVLPRVPGLKNGTDKKGNPIGLHRFKLLIGRPDLTDRQALNYATEYAEAYEAKGFKNGTAAEKAANTLHKKAHLELDEQPQNASERQFFIDVVAAAQAELARRTGVTYSVADIQAMLWYYEKRLYADMGVRDSGDLSYEEAANQVVRLREQMELARVGIDRAEEAASLETFLEPSEVKVPVYHRTPSQDEEGNAIEPFTVFDGLEIPGWFSSTPNDLDFYGDRVMEVYIQLRNPLRLDFDMNNTAQVSEIEKAVGAEAGALGTDGPMPDSIWTVINSQRFMDWAKAQGYDGIIVNENEVETYAVFDAGQVKSADSVGFDTSNPDIMFQTDTNPEPKKTQKAYKLFRKKDGKLYPLFVGANTPVPVGEWVEATVGEQTDKGKVKSKIGPLAFRPGWHAGDVPVARHIGEKSDPSLKAPDLRPADQVWAEVEMAADVDWQTEANNRAQRTKSGKPIARTAHITDQVPLGGFYRYKTNPNMVGEWLIGGQMRVIRELSDAEVQEINDAAGVADLPRASDVMFQGGVDAPATAADFDLKNLRNMTAEEQLGVFSKPGWYIITAARTEYGPNTSPENVQRNEELRKQLTEAGREVIELQGVYAGEPDGTSFLVIGDENEAFTLGAEWGQESVLTREGLVYTDGSDRENVPFTDITYGWDAKDADFRSEFVDGLPMDMFTLKLDFPKPKDITVDDGDGTSHYGARVENGNIKLTHWSTSIRDELDPAMAGTGALPGPERRRSGPKKVFFGMHIGRKGGYRRESGALGRFRHEVLIPAKEMYPWNQDPDGLKDKIPAKLKDLPLQQMGAYEQLIKDAGYKGFFVLDGPLGDVAVLFNKVKPTRVITDEEAAALRSSEFNDFFGKSRVTNMDGSPKLVFHSTKASVDFPGFRYLSHFGTAQAAHDRMQPRNVFGTVRYGENARVLPVYLRMENPLYLGQEKTWGEAGVAWQDTRDMMGQVADTLKAEGKEALADRLWDLFDNEIIYEQTEDIGNYNTAITRYTTAQLEHELTMFDTVFEKKGTLAQAHEALAFGMNQVINVLEEAGYDGLTYENVVEDRGSISYVTFRPEQVKGAFNRGTWDVNESNILYQSAWHGSGAIFDRFSTDHMGTGEGAQAFGWGLYFAESKGIAEYYRESIAGQAGEVNASNRRILVKLGNEQAQISGVHQLAPMMDSTLKTLGVLPDKRTHKWMYPDGETVFPAAVFKLYLEEGLRSGVWPDNLWLEGLVEDELWADRDVSDEERMGLPAQIDELLDWIAEQDIEFATPEVNPGRLYKVKVPDHSEVLNWEKTIGEHSQEIQAQIQQLDEAYKGIVSRRWENDTSELADKLFQITKHAGTYFTAIDAAMKQDRKPIPELQNTTLGEWLRDQAADLVTVTDENNRMAAEEIIEAITRVVGNINLVAVMKDDPVPGEYTRKEWARLRGRTNLVGIQAHAEAIADIMRTGNAGQAEADDNTARRFARPLQSFANTLDSVSFVNGFNEEVQTFELTVEELETYIQRLLYNREESLASRLEAGVELLKRVSSTVNQTPRSNLGGASLPLIYSELGQLRNMFQSVEAHGSDPLANMTGKDFYYALGDHLATEKYGHGAYHRGMADELASKTLAKYGVPGHIFFDNTARYRGDMERYNYVIYDDSVVEIESYEQRQGKGPHGAIILPKEMSAQAVIKLFDSANMSTVLHESGHFFLWQLQKQAADGLTFASDELQVINSWWMKNAKAITAEAQRELATIEQAQVEEYIAVGTTGNGDVDKAIHRALHEQFARGFEAYALEGKSPSNSMRAVFESFAAWLLSWYKSAKALNVDINDDIRGVFDRLLATEQEMETAANREAIDTQIAETAREMGLDEDQYRRLTLLSEEARDEGRQIARKELMTAEAQFRKAEYAARLAEIEDEERQRVNSKPVNRAIQWLGYGRWLGEDQPTELPIELRMDTALLVEEHGKDILAKLPRGRRPLYKKETGLSADEVAFWFGFDSGDAMLKAMMETPKANDEIKASTKARAMEELNDPMADPEAMAEAVVDAFHGEKRGQVIVAELRAINRISSRKKKMTTRAQAKVIAKDLMSRMKVREATQSHRYQAAERKHAEEAARLLAQGEVEAAFEAKRKQLIQHELYSESRKISEMVGKAERLANRLKRKGTRENLAPEYLGAIDDILETFDFRRNVSGKEAGRRERLNAYIDMMISEGRENELAIPKHVRDQAKRLPYKELTTRRLQGVYESLKNIEHTARFKQKLRIAQEERALAEVRQQIRETFQENLSTKEMNRKETKADKRISELKGYVNLVRRADTILRKIDGWQSGIMNKLFREDITKAGAVAMEMREDATAKLDALFSAYTQSERAQMGKAIKWDGYGQSLSKWDIISIALNMGNKDNYERLTSRDSRGAFTEQEVQALVDNLDKRDWDLVQGIWDFLEETYWPQIAAREMRVSGVTPEKVEAQPVQTKFGEYRGGYYPIQYDPRYTKTAAEEANQDLKTLMMAGRFGKAQTKNGHLETRASGGGGRTLQIGMQVLFSHVNNVIHDLAYSEAVVNTWKLLQDPEVRTLFEEYGMLQDHAALELWVQDVAAGPGAGTHALANTMRRLKTGFSLSKLAFNMSTVAIQVTGLTQSMALVGSKYMGKGILQYLTSGRNPYELANEIKLRSKFMQERESTFHRDMMDMAMETQLDPMAGRAKRMQKFMQDAGFFAMQKVQYYAVDVPTWLAAHQKGLDEGMTEIEAATYADDMVGRAQASGLYSDRTQIERGTLGMTSRQNEFVRLFTALGSYMFAKYNVAEEILGRTDFRSPLSVAKMLGDLSLTFMVEALLYNLVKGDLPGMGDDDDEGWAEFIAKETALSVASVFPFIRDTASAVQGFSGGGSYSGISESFGRMVASGGNVLIGDADLGDLRSLNEVAGIMAPGYPSTAIWRIIDGVGVTGEEPSTLAVIMGR